jgi:hypothetical protein
LKTDPTDTGGLFVSRRPGTRPVKYRGVPEKGSPGRQAFDKTLAAAILVVMVLVNLTFWGPIPALCLWFGSRVQYWTDSVSLGIVSAFAAMLALLFGTLMLLRRLDNFWILVRRAGGHDQRTGVLATVFWVTAVIGATGFAIWFFGFSGGAAPTPGS